MSQDQSIPYGYCHCGCGQKTPIARQTRTAIGHVKGEPIRFIHNHHRVRPLLDRFAEKVCDGDVPDHRSDLGRCHVWIGSTNGRYGTISTGGRGSGDYAHRVAYRMAHGSIPDGLEIDHLCRNPLCVNPAHLEAVTHYENLLRSNRSRDASGRFA